MSDNDLIHVLDKRVALYQAQGGFRTAMDSVMLAAACPAKNGESILDLGCGVGSAGLCVLQRVINTTLTGVDIQPDHIEIAFKNAQENGKKDSTTFLCADIRDPLEIGTFNHVICNPPFLEAGKHLHSPSGTKARAMGHTDEDIDVRSWTDQAWAHIKGQGSFTMIHDAGRVDDILHALYSERGGKRFGGVDIIPLFPREGKVAKRIIIRAYKHKKSPAVIHQGITLHRENGDYTKEADNILRHAAPL